ncbi:unnamed protein product [Lymnaea stagnalis]|uniref:Uncharacterized protein n=1 Tax=Lymnaea stagnalis TaxID=6523 RepID=A0AAV2HU44_LYMST
MFRNHALETMQDLTKSLESTEQRYCKMSVKMNQFEISIQSYGEKLEKASSIGIDKFDDLFGICHAFARRLNLLETLKKILCQKITTRRRNCLENNEISRVEPVTGIGNCYEFGDTSKDLSHKDVSSFTFQARSNAPTSAIKFVIPNASSQTTTTITAPTDDVNFDDTT